MTLTVGQRAPSFRLPSAQGPEVGLDDYRGRSNVILLFAKGMACGFCRQKMSQLARGAPRFRELGTEIILVSPTPLERGRFYARNFQLPFPYLCDPDRRVHEAYGLGARARSVAWKVGVALSARRMPPPPETEFGPAKPTLSELNHLFTDDDLGFFIIDKAGVIRYATAGQQVSFEGTKPVGVYPIPSNDEIVRELERCQGVGEWTALPA
jgi:peroxiredoxin